MGCFGDTRANVLPLKLGKFGLMLGLEVVMHDVDDLGAELSVDMVSHFRVTFQAARLQSS